MRNKFLVSILLLLVACSQTYSQGGVGTISGKITDPSGAGIPGAAVTATNTETNQKVKATSASSGDYVLPNLQPGLYTLEVEAAGFKTLTRSNVRVQVADKLGIDLGMEIGEVTQTVAVTAEAPLLRTTDAQTGEVINSLMLENLPQIDRNPLTLLRLAGNVSGSGVAGNGDNDDLRINGGRTGSLDYSVDGANISTGRAHSVAPITIPTMESVAEFKVITNGMAAEYGRSSGGFVDIVTRTGANDFHGEVFEYFRNELFNANSWLQNATSEYVPGEKAQRQKFRNNVFGGTIGGPVILPKLYNGHNKTFFFFNYQGTRYAEAAVNQLGSLPTEAERHGDMSQTLYDYQPPDMWDPFGPYEGSGYGSQVKVNKMGGDGLHVPESYIHPMSAAIIKALPLPNRTPTPGYSQLNNYVGQQSSNSLTDYWAVRLDHNLTDRQRLNFRFTSDRWNNLSSQWMGDLNPPWGASRNGSFTANLGYDYTITPTLVFSGRVGGMYNPQDNGPNWANFDPAQYPYDPEVKKWTVQDRLPFSVMTNFPALGWSNRFVNIVTPHSNYTPNTNFNATAAVTKVWNKHTIKTGFEHRRYYDNFLESGLGWVITNGTATMRESYGGEWVKGTPAEQNALNAGAWGDFLLGMPNMTQQSAPWTMCLNFNYFAGYVQDDWKITPKLTLNYGLRWDTETPVSERNNKLVAWDPDAPSAFTIPSTWNWNNALRDAGLTDTQIALFSEPEWSKNKKYPNGAQIVAGTPEHPGRSLQDYPKDHFAPRLGAAYRLNDKTTLRGSFGVMYFSSTGDYYGMWTTTVPSTSAVSAWDRLDPVTGVRNITWDQMFKPEEYSYYHHTTQEANYIVAGNIAGPTASRQMTTPHEYTWNFTVQRELTPSMILEAGYAGNHSGTLLVQDLLNPFLKEYLNPELAPLLAAKVANPVAGQIMPDDSKYTGETIPLGVLLTSNPSRGYLNVNANNVGRTNYNALNLRLERRMAKGIAFLVNYTFSKALDNTGGPNMSFWGSGSFTKSYQASQTFRDTYGFSPMDRTHRVVWYHDYQLPFGKGRTFLGDPQSTGQKILDHIIGGWEIAGNAIYNSGTPISFGAGGVNSQDQGAQGLSGFIFGSPSEITGSGFSDPNQTLRSPNDPRTGTSRFNPAKFGLAESLTLGNMGPVYPWIRNPGYFNYDLSIMKNFAISERVKLQIRAEAENAFNIRGLGGYSTYFGSSDFGYITGAGNNPRRMQVSGRITF